MMKYWILLSAIFCSLPYTKFLQAQNSIVTGKILDASTKEPIPQACIKTYNNKTHVWYHATSDYYGNYVINNIEPFQYNLSVAIENYTSQQISNIPVKGSGQQVVDFFLHKSDNNKKSFRIETYDYSKISRSTKKLSSQVREINLKNLRADIKRNWHLREDSLCFVTNIYFTTQFFNNYSNFLAGSSKNQIIKLFGNPITSGRNRFEYVIDPPWPAESCLIIYFAFDNRNRLVEVYGVTRHAW